MAVANPCSKEWEEWKRGMEETRKRSWRERVSRWAKVEGNDEEEEEEEDDGQGEEAESKGRGEEEVSEDEEEWKNGNMGGEMAEEGENEVGRGIDEVEKGDEEEDGEAIEADDSVDVEEVEENAMDREFEVVDEKKEEELEKEREKIEESNNKAEEEDSDMKEAKEMEEEEEERVTEAEREVEEIKEVDTVEENEETEAEYVEEEGKEAGELKEAGEKIQENKERDEQDSDMKEAKEMEEEEEERVTEAEREVEEIKEVDAVEENEETEAEYEEEEGKEAEELKEDGEKIQENKERDEQDSDMKEAKEMSEEEEEGNKENKVVEAVEEQGEMEAEDVREEEKGVENEMEWEVQESGEAEEKEVMEADEVEDEQEEGEQEFDGDVRVDGEKDSEEEQAKKEDDEEEEQQEQDETGHHLAEQFREQFRTEDESIQQNQESTSREEGEVDAEENFPDSVESDNEDSDFMGSEDDYYNFQRMHDEEGAGEEQYKDLEELDWTAGNSWRSENSLSGTLTSRERKEQEDECEKLTREEETVTESLKTQDKEFQDDHEKLEEDESTDDEAAAYSADDDEDNNDEDVVKIYYKKAYLTDAFSSLAEFRTSSLLTDLTLSTEDGKSFHVHSLVLAAVSSLVRESLSRSNVENIREDRGVHRWSFSLGPEVDHVGIEAVVEFAYIGLISCLNKNTVNQIKAAAQTLGAPRVLDLCKEEEEKSTKTGGQKKEERLSAADQMMISLQSIKQLWRDRVGCDVILEALGGSFHVHRVMLAVCSDYFRGMFTLGMKESLQPCVSLPFLLASELQVLIDCSYSGALPLSWSCVFEITTTALQLQYQPVLSLCLTFLQQEINPHSCLDVASFAEAYEMVQLLEIAEDFVLRQFQKVACTSKFKDLPAKQLLRYLNSHSLCVPSELVVFKAVVAWIQAKPKKRLRLAKELMKTIHFPLMTFKEFKEVQSMNMWSDHSLAELYEAVFEDFCSNETTPQSQCRIYLPKESLVLIGGDQTFQDLGSRSISRELWFGNSLQNHTGIRKAMEWRRLGEMPDPARFSHEVAVLEGQLYVFGGKKYYGISDTLNSVCRYDPVQNSWESLAEMQEKRCSFSVVVLDGKIYALGGNCDLDYIEGVERYCPITNSWSFACPLDLPLRAHVAKVLHGQIFVSGGLSSNDQCLASMFLYHPETGSTYLANMAEPRAQHCMETLGECLYVAGGITTANPIHFVDQLACEVYNPESDSWTTFTHLPVPHVGAGSAVLEGKFYVLGGYTQDDYSDTKLVHRYDPTTQRWENMGKMPGPNNDIRACLLRLPPHFRL